MRVKQRNIPMKPEFRNLVNGDPNPIGHADISGRTQSILIPTIALLAVFVIPRSATGITDLCLAHGERRRSRKSLLVANNPPCSYIGFHSP